MSSTSLTAYVPYTKPLTDNQVNYINEYIERQYRIHRGREAGMTLQGFIEATPSLQEEGLRLYGVTAGPGTRTYLTYGQGQDTSRIPIRIEEEHYTQIEVCYQEPSVIDLRIGDNWRLLLPVDACFHSDGVLYLELTINLPKGVHQPPYVELKVKLGEEEGIQSLNYFAQRVA